jgi:hypothetical protein
MIAVSFALVYLSCPSEPGDPFFCSNFPSIFSYFYFYNVHMVAKLLRLFRDGKPWMHVSS